MSLLRNIEGKALNLRQQPPDGDIISLDDVQVKLNLPLDRPLYSPPLKPRINTQLLVEGTTDNNADALFNQIYVDKSRLEESLRRALRHQDLLHQARTDGAFGGPSRRCRSDGRRSVNSRLPTSAWRTRHRQAGNPQGVALANFCSANSPSTAWQPAA